MVSTAEPLPTAKPIMVYIPSDIQAPGLHKTGGDAVVNGETRKKGVVHAV